MLLLVTFIVVLSALPIFFSLQLFPRILENLLFWTGLFFLSICLVRSRFLPLRMIGWFLPPLVFLLIFLSYGFFLFAGNFINYGIVSFAFANLSQLVLHFLQHGIQLFLLLGLIWILATVLCLVSINRTRHLRIKLRYATAFLGLSLLLMQLNREANPITAFFWKDESFVVKADLKNLVPILPAPTPLSPMATSPVIIIYLESWRYDLLKNKPSPAPRLESVLREGYFFNRSYASASHSNYSNPAFWFSQYPMRSRQASTLRRSDPWPRKSVFTALKDLGYSTAYVSSQNEKWGNMIGWMKAPGIDFFFHSEDYRGTTWENKDDLDGLALMIKMKIATSGKVEDSETMKIAWDWIGKNSTVPFAIGITLQNTHFNYFIPDGAEQPFQPSVIDFPTPYYVWPKDKKEHVYNRYLNAVYNVDKLLGEFFDQLKASGLWEKSCILITGDGGEAFYEHGFGNHSGPAYDECVRSLTWLKPPAQNYNPQWAVVEKPVSHVDLIPSIFDILALPIPGEFQGIPFSSDSRPEVYIHTNVIVAQNAIVQWPWKLMHNLRPVSKGYELYNLQDDPGEEKNLFKSGEKTSQDLKRLLNLWISNQESYYATPGIYQKFYPPRHQTEKPP